MGGLPFVAVGVWVSVGVVGIVGGFGLPGLESAIKWSRNWGGWECFSGRKSFIGREIESLKILVTVYRPKYKVRVIARQGFFFQPFLFVNGADQSKTKQRSDGPLGEVRPKT